MDFVETGIAVSFCLPTRQGGQWHDGQTGGRVGFVIAAATPTSNNDGRKLQEKWAEISDGREEASLAGASTAKFLDLLAAASHGDAEASERVFPLIYDELRRLADRYMRGERPDHTLQATALVHEAYLKLVGQGDASWTSRAHFLAAAAQAMRRILVNHAKSKKRVKRGGGRAQLVLEEALAAFEDRAIDLVDLDDSLRKLAAIAPDQARIVELRFFAGLTVEETARMLGTSERTIYSDWAMARAWLRGELGVAPEDEARGADENNDA